MEGKFILCVSIICSLLPHLHFSRVLIHHLSLALFIILLVHVTVQHRYYLDVDLLVVHPFVASPANKFVTVKWAWYAEDNAQFFQAFIAAAPRNEIIKNSLTIMLELLNGTRAMRGDHIGTQAMQDAWAELAQDDASIASHGKNEEVFLLSEHKLGTSGKLPTQTDKATIGYTDMTCNFVVADDERSVYFYTNILGSRFCGN